MSILYPLNKPTSADDISNKVHELLQNPEEWTQWETVVLNALGEHADVVLGHYLRHVWYEIEGLGNPDLDLARQEIKTAANYLLGLMRGEHAMEAPVHDDAIEMEINRHNVVSVLLLHAAILVDDLVESLRRGPCAIEDSKAHGLEMDIWADLLEFRENTTEFSHACAALECLDAGIEDFYSDSDDYDREYPGAHTIDRREAKQNERNKERIEKVVLQTNENFRLPENFQLTIAHISEDTLRLTWGRPPMQNAGAGMEEIQTRPFGSETTHLEHNSLFELCPRVISDIARAGRFAVLCLGRDAEIRSAGHTLAEPPIWAWAGPIPLVTHVLAQLRSGKDVDITQNGMTAGPVLSGTIKVGEIGSYTYNARTLDENLIVEQKIPDTLAHACIGNPVSVLIGGPTFEDNRITIEACEVSGDETDLDLLSPLVRLIPAPDGYNQNPETAWLGLLENFDEQRIYGERLYRKRPESGLRIVSMDELKNLAQSTP